MLQAVPSLPESMRLRSLDAIDSTNAEAMRLAATGETGPLWITAKEQTAGRGRSGRGWTSVDGNLYCSLLTRLDCPTSAVPQLSLLAGVAVVDALKAAAARQGHTIPGLRLKWPNDVLIGKAKLVGILPESSTIPGSSGFIAVIGIGINLAGQPAGIGREVTHLAAHGPSVSPELALELIAHAMQNWFARWNCGGGFAEVRAAWLARAGAVGEAISVNTGATRVEGDFVEIDATGALILRDRNGILQRFTYGDVTLNTPAMSGGDALGGSEA